MESLKNPFKGVAKDFKGRLACYKKDWLNSCSSGPRFDSSLFSSPKKKKRECECLCLCWLPFTVSGFWLHLHTFSLLLLFP